MSPKKTGMSIGILLLLQVFIGMFIQFSVMGKLIAEPGFLLNGAEHNLLIGTAIIPMLLIGMFNLLIAAICHRQFAHIAPVFTLFFLAFAGAKLAIDANEAAHIMELVSYSQHYVTASADLKGQLEVMAQTVKAGRNWAHFISVLLSGAFLFCLYGLLSCTTRLPKPLLIIAMSASLMQIIAVSQAFFGLQVIKEMLIPIGLTQLLLPVYFMFKGIEGKNKGKNTN